MTLTAQGKRLETAWAGPSEARDVIVLLHEGLGCVALWRDFPEALAAATGWSVLSYSRAGYGQSDLADLPRPLDYMTREAMHVLPDVLSQVKARRIVLMGHSDGATIAAEHAGRCPDPRLAGVVLMAPHFFTEEMGLAQIARARAAFGTTDMPERMAKYHRDPAHCFEGWAESWLHPEFATWNVSDAIAQIQVPILGVQGKDDQYGTAAQVMILQERNPTRADVHLLEACAHAPHEDQSAQVLGLVHGWLGGLGPVSRV